MQIKEPKFHEFSVVVKKTDLFSLIKKSGEKACLSKIMQVFSDAESEEKVILNFDIQELKEKES